MSDCVAHARPRAMRDLRYAIRDTRYAIRERRRNMMGGHGPRAMMERETSKPKNVGETLKRFGSYFRPFWPVLLLAVALVVISTWTQVTAPDLLGQAVDCYLSPTQASSGFSNFPPGG